MADSSSNLMIISITDEAVINRALVDSNDKEIKLRFCVSSVRLADAPSRELYAFLISFDKEIDSPVKLDKTNDHWEAEFTLTDIRKTLSCRFFVSELFKRPILQATINLLRKSLV